MTSTCSLEQRFLEKGRPERHRTRLSLDNGDNKQDDVNSKVQQNPKLVRFEPNKRPNNYNVPSQLLFYLYYACIQDKGICE